MTPGRASCTTQMAATQSWIEEEDVEMTVRRRWSNYGDGCQYQARYLYMILIEVALRWELMAPISTRRLTAIEIAKGNRAALMGIAALRFVLLPLLSM